MITMSITRYDLIVDRRCIVSTSDRCAFLHAARMLKPDLDVRDNPVKVIIVEYTGDQVKHSLIFIDPVYGFSMI